ncbi:hypothetical protein RUM44_004100 [Polyplax serrata]|uniref:Uncharacterized protein n=1 Tax=Polyplax serrata TaxID=468196 RepID=A0ABR1B299_POLSC
MLNCSDPECILHHHHYYHGHVQHHLQDDRAHHEHPTHHRVHFALLPQTATTPQVYLNSSSGPVPLPDLYAFQQEQGPSYPDGKSRQLARRRERDVRVPGFELDVFSLDRATDSKKKVPNLSDLFNTWGKLEVGTRSNYPGGPVGN